MRQHAWTAVIVLLCLLILPDAVLSLDLRERANKIAFSDRARAFGLNSGNLVVSDGDSVIVYNKRFRPGPKLLIKPDQRLTVSENGLYFGIASSYKTDDSHAELLQRVDVRDAGNNVIWAFDGLMEGECNISPSGDYMVFATGTAGAFDWQIMLCSANQTAALLDIDSFKEIRFVSDGSRFVIDGGPRGVRMYDKTGRLLKAFEYQNGFALSSGGKYLALLKDGVLSIYRDTSLLSRNDAVDREIEAMKISEELHRLYYVSAYSLVVIDIDKGTRVWDYKTESAQYRFSSLDISPDQRFLACGMIYNLGTRISKDKRYPRGYVYLFDIGRNIMRRAEFPTSGWAAGQPEVGFWTDQRTILVRTNDRILTFEMI